MLELHKEVVDRGVLAAVCVCVCTAIRPQFDRSLNAESVLIHHFRQHGQAESARFTANSSLLVHYLTIVLSPFCHNVTPSYLVFDRLLTII